MGSRQAQDDRSIDGDGLLARVVELCHERKAEDLVSLDVRELVDYMDHLVICTGRSARQNRAIAEHVITQLKREHRVLPLSRAGLDAGSWVCVDFVDVVLHVFEPETRDHYDLELLWGEAERAEHEAPAGLESDASDADLTDSDVVEAEAAEEL